MRSQFYSQLQKLNDELISMGEAIENAIYLATQSLIKKDIKKANEAIELEEKIDACEKNIETLCFKLLIQQQPVASDLRIISSALKMITDMERIGDQARDIAEISIQLSNDKYIKELVHIPQMANSAINMVNTSIEAFINKDVTLAEEVIKCDDIVDELFDVIKDDLYKLMVADKNNYKQALDLLMIAKYYERIGDHAENIAEWVIYSITGVHKSN